MKTIAIVGVGLIGGSFALAVRKAGFTGEILGVSSPASIEAALRLAAISRGVSLQEAAGADLVYLSQPIDGILASLEQLRSYVGPGTLVTDAGSTKVMIVRKAQETLPPGAFLGGHPLAGKEKRGIEAAEADLFRDRPYVLTPARDQHPRVPEFRSLLESIGANLIEVTAADHDRILAYTSHLPQLISTALAATVAIQKDVAGNQMFGPGLLDMTRLALSPPELWTSIVATNKAEILAALEAYTATLADLKRAVTDDDLTALFQTSTEFSRRIRNLCFVTGK